MRCCSIGLFVLLSVAICDVEENELGAFPQLNQLTEGSKTREELDAAGACVCVCRENSYIEKWEMCASRVCVCVDLHALGHKRSVGGGGGGGFGGVRGDLAVLCACMGVCARAWGGGR